MLINKNNYPQNFENYYSRKQTPANTQFYWFLKDNTHFLPLQ